MGLFRPKHGRAKEKGWYLKNAKAESFGAVSKKVLGPFGPGLNVVHGENEAGKTTFANLIGGVMFGWEDGRSGRNTYKPVSAGRSGSLSFAQVGDTTKAACLSRAKNADGVQGDGWLLGDIDRETFGEIFSLNSDQLRSMGDAGQVTSRLLTAGAGTAVSPAQVRADLNARIATYTSRSEKCPHSIVRLISERDALAAAIEETRAASDELRREDANLSALREERDDIQDEVRTVNRLINRLNSAEVGVRQCDEREEALEEARENVVASKLEATQQEDYSDVPARLLVASPAEETALRERLETLEEERESARVALDSARKRYEESFAEYERSYESKKKEDLERAASSEGGMKVVSRGALFALAAVIFAGLGAVMATMEGNSLWVPMVSLFVGAGIFAVVAVVCAIVGVSRGRTNKKSTTQDAEARWLLDKEKDRYEQAKADWAQSEKSLTIQLEGMGLRKAEGSLRAARVILDRAQNAREQKAAAERAEKSLDARLGELEEEAGAVRARRSEIMASCGMLLDGGSVALAAEIADAEDRREQLARNLEEANLHIGQVEQRLDEARGKHDLDALRMQHQQVLTRLSESQKEFACLLLERRLLDEAVREWESSSQPEVYRRAQELLSKMTDGRWTRIVVTEDGQISVGDEFGEVRSPLLLSTGTCQQLYLALRIALLETAEFVGRNVPVICDDILVNFDERRRRAAANALAQLGHKRQVILFTCHKDVVATLRRADPLATLIEL